MAPIGKAILSGGLIALALGAAVWSAERPGHGIWAEIAHQSRIAADGVLAWVRSGPAQAHPDWREAAHRLPGADADRGAEAMRHYGCGACHTIPGVTGANGSVGPHLSGFADRAYVAGVLPNEPAGLVRWLVNPTVHAPDTAMPDLGVTEAEARDMAAHLYGLRGD